MRGRDYRAAAAMLAVTAVLFCAKKMLPPSPDRFAPRLVGVEATSRVRVELEFDEPLDGLRLAAESVSIRDESGNELEVRGVSLGRRPERISIWTAVQAPIRYEVSGVVRDEAGNPRRFARMGFKGSQRLDTIPPRIVSVRPQPGATRVRPLTVAFRFSEAVDTAGVSGHLIVPKELDSLYSRVWESDWQTLGFVCRDSVPPGVVQYFLLPSGTPDLESNRSREPASTYFTTDSLLAAVVVRGRANWGGGRLGTGVVFFDDTLTRALAVILDDGSFACRLQAGVYAVRAAADTNSDGLVDLTSPEQQFETAAESLQVMLAPEPEPRPLNAYRR